MILLPKLLSLAVQHLTDHKMEEILPLKKCILQVSGRISFEIVQKALLAGIPVVAAVSAPTTLAIELAEESGITLLGFVRDGGYNIYTHSQRVI